MENSENKIKEIIKEIVKKDIDIKPEDSLVNDYGFNSLQMLELAGAIEDEFDVLVPMNKVMHIKTVQDIYAAMEESAELLAV